MKTFQHEAKRRAVERIVRYKGLAVLIVISVLSASCFTSQDTRENNEISYVSVDNSFLTESEFKSLVPSEFYDKLTPEHKKAIMNEWINEELLYQEALRLGIDRETEIARMLEKSKRDFISNELLERELATVELPGEDQLKQYFEEHNDYFMLQSNEYQVRYALLDNYKDAMKFWNNVKNGASFSELAKTESKDPSSKSGGELGIVNEESIEPAIWSALVNTYEKLGLRKISDTFPVIDGFGLIIIDKIYEKGSVKPFEAVRDQLMDFYIAEESEKAKNDLLEKLKSHSEITYHF
ncbi:peptidylprolyl isomerase [Candidatus Latescibacterota bacterium]